MARLLFFGKLADLAGGRERDLPLPDTVDTVDAVIELLASEDELLGAALNEKSVRCIINERIDNTPGIVSDSDEIAFLPAVSGG